MVKINVNFPLTLEMDSLMQEQLTSTIVLEIIAHYKQMRKMRVAAQAHNFVSR